MKHSRASLCLPVILATSVSLADGAWGAGVLPATAPMSVLDTTVRKFTEARTRAVWCRQAQGASEDFFARGTQLQLWGYDSDDGRGPRVILEPVTNYNRPMITPGGDRIVYNNYPENLVCVTDWDGSNLRVVTNGIATDVWRDPLTRTEWVYAIAQEVEEYRGGPIIRFQLDNPSVVETVWDRSLVTWDNVQLSADGTRLSGQFPHPNGGYATVPNGATSIFGNGCWTSVAPDNSYLVWLFDGPHRNLEMYAANGGAWKTNINSAPGIDGYEVYHPRWSNHVRYFAMTGPYKVGKMGENLITSGGLGVEVYLGRFSGDFTTVEEWLRLTEDAHGDFFPDVWIEGGDTASASLPGDAATAPATTVPVAGPAMVSAVSSARPVARVKLEARLVRTIPTPSLASIAPYTRALVVYTYDVARVLEGQCREPRILVAHWAIRDRKILDLGNQAGGTYPLELELFDAHPELEGERLLMDTDELDLPLYYDTSP